MECKNLEKHAKAVADALGISSVQALDLFEKHPDIKDLVYKKMADDKENEKKIIFPVTSHSFEKDKRYTKDELFAMMRDMTDDELLEFIKSDLQSKTVHYTSYIAEYLEKAYVETGKLYPFVKELYVSKSLDGEYSAGYSSVRIYSNYANLCNLIENDVNSLTDLTLLYPFKRSQDEQKSFNAALALYLTQNQFLSLDNFIEFYTKKANKWRESSYLRNYFDSFSRIPLTHVGSIPRMFLLLSKGLPIDEIETKMSLLSENFNDGLQGDVYCALLTEEGRKDIALEKMNSERLLLVYNQVIPLTEEDLLKVKSSSVLTGFVNHSTTIPRLSDDNMELLLKKMNENDKYHYGTANNFLDVYSKKQTVDDNFLIKVSRNQPTILTFLINTRKSKDLDINTLNEIIYDNQRFHGLYSDYNQKVKKLSVSEIKGIPIDKQNQLLASAMDDGQIVLFEQINENVSINGYDSVAYQSYNRNIRPLTFDEIKKVQDRITTSQGKTFFISGILKQGNRRFTMEEVKSLGNPIVDEHSKDTLFNYMMKADKNFFSFQNLLTSPQKLDNFSHQELLMFINSSPNRIDDSNWINKYLEPNSNSTGDVYFPQATWNKLLTEANENGKLHGREKTKILKEVGRIGNKLFSNPPEVLSQSIKNIEHHLEENWRIEVNSDSDKYVFDMVSHDGHMEMVVNRDECFNMIQEEFNARINGTEPFTMKDVYDSVYHALWER